MDKRKLKIFSFFSGSGFLDLGFEMNGFEVDLVNEYHAPFMEAYQYSRQCMGLRKPRYGYFNIDINDFLGARKNPADDQYGLHAAYADPGSQKACCSLRPCFD